MPPSQEAVYIIDRVLEYKPTKGYLVHWKGFGKADRSWQKPSDMPFVFNEDMARVREEYLSNLKKLKHAPPPDANTNLRATDCQNRHDIRNKSGLSWTVDEVLGYSPTKGYYVSWVGCGEQDNSWQRAKDMPKGCREDMKRAKSNYERAVSGKAVLIQDLCRSTRSNEDDEGSRSRVVEQIRRGRVPNAKRLVVPLVEPTVRKPSQVERSIKRLVKRDQRHVHSIVAFDPARGYLVHWKGEPSCNDSWLVESDLDGKFENQMRLASERYCDNLVTRTSC